MSPSLKFQDSTVEAKNCKGPNPVSLFVNALPFLVAFMRIKCKWLRKKPSPGVRTRHLGDTP